MGRIADLKKKLEVNGTRCAVMGITGRLSVEKGIAYAVGSSRKSLKTLRGGANVGMEQRYPFIQKKDPYS